MTCRDIHAELKKNRHEVALTAVHRTIASLRDKGLVAADGPTSVAEADATLAKISAHLASGKLGKTDSPAAIRYRITDKGIPLGGARLLADQAREMGISARFMAFLEQYRKRLSKQVMEAKGASPE